MFSSYPYLWPTDTDGRYLMDSASRFGYDLIDHSAANITCSYYLSIAVRKMFLGVILRQFCCTEVSHGQLATATAGEDGGREVVYDDNERRYICLHLSV